MTLQDKLAKLFALRRSFYDAERIDPAYFTLLERLGQPHLHLPPVIHVAGTNGKGSTIAFMRAILESAGYRVHVYTSPHLLRFHERIVLSGRIIDDATLEGLLDEVMVAAGGLDLHFLEITPALAMAAFARHPADIVLLETGLGGRLDHTNIVPHPLLTIITTLSFDHTDYLGDTIEQIALEKAGIMRTGTPCLVGEQIFPQAIPALQRQAQSLGVRLVTPEQWPRPKENLPRPSLTGAHQIANAGLAVAALMTQNHFAIPPTAFAAGVAGATWPARLQRIDNHPALAHRPGWSLWLDGGHNDSAGMVLAQQAKQWQDKDPAPLHIVTGMMGNKDPAPFARALAPLASSITTISIPHHEEACIPPADLARAWGDMAQVSDESWPDLCKKLALNGEKGRILVTGSLYLAEMLLA